MTGLNVSYVGTILRNEVRNCHKVHPRSYDSAPTVRPMELRRITNETY